MINLLPDENKKQVEWEYRGRILIVLLLFTFLALVVSIVLAIPSYFISQTKYSLVKDKKTDVASEDNADLAKTGDTIKNINGKIALLKPASLGKTKVNQLINSIVVNKNNTILIKSINYEMRGTTAKIDITGSSQTREALLSFVDRLRKEKYFTEVYSPVSNLVKDRDIDFSIQVAITPNI